MSFVYKVVEDLVDDVIGRMKKGLDDYAATARQDIEVYVDKLLRKAVKGMAVGLLGAVVVSAGLIFSLVGLVAYLGPIVGPALAWGIVGLGMVGFGAVLLFALLRSTRRGASFPSRRDGGN
ncbi:MAG TPA: phage holin family protein [Nitrososphaerales archaeon]|nr:phage holin family protein [Nitrososphaerales archaeon]